MKTFVAVAIFALIAVAYAGKAHLNDEQKKKAEESHKVCVEETKIDEAVVKKAEEGIYSDDVKLKEYALCFSKRAEFMDDKGEIQLAVIKKKLLAMNIKYSEEDADKVIAKCAIKKDTPQQTAFESFKCFHDNLPKGAPAVA